MAYLTTNLTLHDALPIWEGTGTRSHFGRTFAGSTRNSAGGTRRGRLRRSRMGNGGGAGAHAGVNRDQVVRCLPHGGGPAEIGRAHVCTPVTCQDRMPPSA